MKYKKINKKEKLFYVFETSTTTFSIFDSAFDEPIYFGNWNMCAGIIKNIKKNMKDATILYYTKQKSGLLQENPQWSHIA
jgi:hypothetical protein